MMSSQVRENVPRIQLRPAGATTRPFGLSAVEIVAGALTLIVFVLVVVYYFTSLRPERERLNELDQQLELQRKTIIGITPGGESGQPSTVKEALSTLETFRSEHLKPRSQGEIALYREINTLATKNSLRLASGIEMKKEDVNPDEQKSTRRKAAEGLPKVFPQSELQFTVAGQYPNIRKFISELERNKQFVVIKAVELTNVEEVIGGRGARRTQAAGVSLSITMDAYFQP